MIKMRLKNIVNKLRYYFILAFLFIPTVCLADQDPMTTGGKKFAGILFGTFGTTLCSIIIGATFIMAKVGKVSWDRFLFVGFCAAGFLGAPSIVYMIKSFIGNS